MLKITKDQERAIYESGCDILVSAAAGSGKTAVLSERVLNKLKEGHDITEFLIVTFTNAAAAEMKERISNKITEEMERSPENAFLSKQLMLINKASITTIHSFCLDIIRNNFHLLNIDPAFKIADETETRFLKLEAAEEMLEYMYAAEPVLTEKLCAVFGGRDEDFEGEIIAFYDFLQSMPDPKEWLHVQCEKYNIKGKDLSGIEWIKYLKADAKIKFAALKDEFLKLEKLSSDFGLGYSAAIGKDVLLMEEFVTAADLPWDKFKAQISSFAFGSIGRKAKDEDESACDEVKGIRAKLKEQVEKIRSEICLKSDEDIISEIEQAYPIILTLEKCINVFDERFMLKKHDGAMIDFADFEHMALGILKDETNGVAKRLKEKFTEIFVDEYQDCNQAQEALFSLISRKHEGKSINMFMVGDMKQSIYRFRQADPDIFSDKAKRYTDDGLQRKICLNKNFRSTSVILSAINRIFENCMSESTGGVDYGDEERLYFKSDEIPQDEAKCELLIVDSKSEAVDDDEPESSIGYEARVIAKRILELNAQGARFKDCAVLLRSIKPNLGAFETEFKRFNIPYYVDGGGGFFDTFEIRFFMSLLKICDNPYQDIPLVSVLFSPIFGFSEEDFLKIRMGHKKGSFYKAMIKYGEPGETLDKTRSFLNTLSTWRDMAISLTPREFCRYLCDEIMFFDFVLSLPGGEERKSNLDLFLKQVESFDDKGVNDLFGFVLYMDKLSAGGESAGAKTLSESVDVVRIMSIHKSKGLQFKNVFVAGCSKKIGGKDTKAKLIYHKSMGIGMTMVNMEKHKKYRPVSKIAVAAALNRESISEEMRILYVALTRAEQRLICTATVKNASEKDFYNLKKSPELAQNYLDWICNGLNEDWIIKIFRKEEAAAVAEEKDRVKEIDLPEVSGFVKEALDYRYEYQAATTTPTKLSVSEIKKADSYDDPRSMKLFSPELKTYPEFIQGKEVSGAAAGTVNHLVLKEISFENPDVDKCIETLSAKKLLSEEMKKYIYRDEIIGFVNSEIFSRMAKSKKVMREMQFNLPMESERIFSGVFGETVLVQGIADCIFEEDGGYVIVDYKTDRHVSTARLEEYKRQVEIYAEAAKIIFDAPVKEKIIYFLKTGEAVKA